MMSGASFSKKTQFIKQLVLNTEQQNHWYKAIWYGHLSITCSYHLLTALLDIRDYMLTYVHVSPSIFAARISPGPLWVG